MCKELNFSLLLPSPPGKGQCGSRPLHCSDLAYLHAETLLAAAERFIWGGLCGLQKSNSSFTQLSSVPMFKPGFKSLPTSLQVNKVHVILGPALEGIRLVCPRPHCSPVASPMLCVQCSSPCRCSQGAASPRRCLWQSMRSQKPWSNCAANPGGTPRCHWYLQAAESLTSGDDRMPLSAVEMFRDPSEGRCCQLSSCSAPEDSSSSLGGEQMSLVLKLIMDSGE